MRNPTFLWILAVPLQGSIALFSLLTSFWTVIALDRFAPNSQRLEILLMILPLAMPVLSVMALCFLVPSPLRTGLVIVFTLLALVHPASFAWVAIRQKMEYRKGDLASIAESKNEIQGYLDRGVPVPPDIIRREIREIQVQHFSREMLGQAAEKNLLAVIQSAGFDPHSVYEGLVHEADDQYRSVKEKASSPLLNLLVGYVSASTVETLLARGADPNQRDSSKYARTALLAFAHRIAFTPLRANHLKATFDLLLKSGADITAQDGLGRDSLWYLKEALKFANNPRTTHNGFRESKEIIAELIHLIEQSGQ